VTFKVETSRGGRPRKIHGFRLERDDSAPVGFLLRDLFMTAINSIDVKRMGRWMSLGLLCLAAGCASGPKSKPQDYTFFPPPPDEPRIQYLMSFGSESDLGAKSKFSEFVVGEEKIHRPIWKPYGIAVRKGQVYVCDTQAANVSTVDLVKRKMRYLRPTGQAAMKSPINVAVDQDGTRYVTDTKRGQVLVYGPDDRLAAEIGRMGEMKPCGIALAGDRLYVTDLSNHCVRVYAKASRQLLFQIPRNPGDEKSKLLSPTNVAIDPNGRICVSDTGGFAVQIYDAEGNHLRTMGEQGLEAGRFALPKGIGVDHEGRVYVVDAATAVVQLFDAEGRLLMFFGEPQSSGPGALYLPAGLAVDYTNAELFQSYAAPGFKLEYLIFITNQAGPQKVSVFGFLRKS
jgi:DNA-binding beta-propeller fold protein YncE